MTLKSNLKIKFKILFILLVLSLPFIKSCKKDVILSSQKSALLNEVANVQKLFKNNSYDKELTFSYADSIQIFWKPNWEKAKENIISDTIKYIYIPLDGQLTTKNNKKVKQLATVNTEKYLIIKKTTNTSTLNLATYTINLSNNNKKLTGNSSIKKYRNHSIPFNNFSGTLSLKNISTQKTNFFNYSNGAFARSNTLVNSATQTNSYQICTYYLNCVWINNFPMYCGNVAYGESQTMYYNVDTIEECYSPPVGYWTDGTNPCIPDWSFGGSYITSECMTVDDPPPPPPDEPGGGGDGGGGPGNPPPNQPAEPDTALNNIMRDHCLTDGQLDLLNSAMNDYLAGQGNQESGCVQKSIYLKMKSANRKIGFCVDSINYASTPGNGFYNPFTKTLIWKSGYGVDNVILFGHEFFHAYQDVHYNGGINQYGNEGFPNIEFEQVVLNDVLNGSEYATGMGYNAPEEVVSEYRGWISSITKGDTTFPKQYSDLNGQYFHFLNLFYLHSPYQNAGSINSNLKPTALLSVFSSTNCK